MLSKCANPSCKARFRSLREGRLFHFEITPTGHNHRTLLLVGGKKPPQSVEHYWLCGDCSSLMTLTHSRNGIAVVPLHADTTRHAHRAAAS